MTKKIAIIDPFIKSPNVQCANELSYFFHLNMSYHMPHLLGLETLRCDESDAYIVMGSASHVTIPLPWHEPLREFLLKKLNLGKPILGICFGHQFLCHAFGSTVEFVTTEDKKFTGMRKITITKDHGLFKTGEEFRLCVSHLQAVTKLGVDLTEIGKGLNFDIVTHNKLPFFGTQAHPETGKGILPLEDFQRVRADGMRFIRYFLKNSDLL